MKLRDMTVGIITPLALRAARPYSKLLDEIADRERAQIERATGVSDMQDRDESERLRTALKRLVDESERVAWQGANNEPPTYPHLAAIIEVAKEALGTNQEDQRPYCFCLIQQRDAWTDSCAICGGKIVTMAR